MYALLMILHLLVCLALVAVVLMQSGKGGGLAGGAFGGSAQTVFGGRGATDFITRATMVLGAAFFVTSLILALLSSGMGRGSRSLMQEEARRAASSAPAQLPSRPGATQPQGQAPATTPQAPSGTAPAPSGNR
jgi:preprotein translocase subunit SecG